jgi:hypothetical protein
MKYLVYKSLYIIINTVYLFWNFKFSDYTFKEYVHDLEFYEYHYY